MFGFNDPSHKTSVVVDIGSSSVGVAIVCVHEEGKIETVWSHREQSLIHEEVSSVKQLNLIKTALTNAFLELNQTGLKALRDQGHTCKISEVQATIAAPFSYTITKTISLKDEHPFAITEDTITELVESGKKQSKLVFATNKLANELGLEITHGDVVNISVNDYTVYDPVGQEGRSLSLTYLETAIARDVSDTLNNTVEKFFPSAKISQYSFMYVFYLTLRNLHPNTAESCLIDVTSEATEIGIVRDDALKHTTFTPVGTYTLARDIAREANVPREEAFSYMKDSLTELSERLNDKSQQAVEGVLEQYKNELVAMFKKTGDKLSIPSSIFLHSDKRTEDFFREMIEFAAKEATGKSHNVHPVTAKVLGVPEHEDTAIVAAINFLAHKTEFMTILPKKI